MDLIADLFRIYWLRPEMPFLKLDMPTYWQEVRAITNCMLENATEDIGSLVCTTLIQSLISCHAHLLPLPLLSVG